MKKRFAEEQIIGFLREAEAGLPVKELCRRHGFSEESYYLWRSQLASFEAFGTDFGRLDDHFRVPVLFVLSLAVSPPNPANMRV